MARTLLAILAGAAIVAVGCKPPADNGTATSSDSGKAPMSTTDATTDPVAETAKCELCGADFPKADLAMHDGKMACEACIEAHGH